MKRTTILLILTTLLTGCAQVCAHIPETPLVHLLPGVCPVATPTPAPAK